MRVLPPRIARRRLPAVAALVLVGGVCAAAVPAWAAQPPVTSASSSSATSPATSSTVPSIATKLCATTVSRQTWPGGYLGNVTVLNDGASAKPWTVTFRVASGVQVQSGWNADVTATAGDGATVITARAPAWNTELAPGARTTIGFTAAGPATPGPTDVRLDGVLCSTSVTPTAEPAGPRATPPPATSSGSSGTGALTDGHVGNPYAGAEGYLNPDYAAEVNAAARQTGGSLGASMAEVAKQPTAVWLDRIATVTGGPGVTRTLTGHLDAALAQEKKAGRPVTITLVVYDLPNRDCAANASNGELTVAANGLARYEHDYLTPLARILADPRYQNLRIATIVEPDSLPNLVTNLSKPACAQAGTAYEQGIQFALNRLHAIGNVYTYLDLGHSGWLGWDSNFQPAVDLITRVVKGTDAGPDSVDGFVSNTAGYTPTTEPYLPDPALNVGGQPVKSASFYQWNPYPDEQSYDTAMRKAFLDQGFPATIGMLIDTSRNGWGGSGRPGGVSTSTTLNTYVDASRTDRRLARGNWCNQPGGIGTRPTADPAPGFDAWVWVKPPGESDGTSNRARTTPDAEGKRFDAMCDPAAQSSAAAVRTGAMAGAPAAGHWFGSGFTTLVRNARPAL